MGEEDLIRLQFQNILGELVGELVGSKIQPTATAIMRQGNQWFNCLRN